MFIFKGIWASGQIDVYEADSYTIRPPKENEDREIVTCVILQTSEGVQAYEVGPGENHYDEIYIENNEGRTIHTIRPATRVRKDPDSGQAHDVPSLKGTGRD